MATAWLREGLTGHAGDEEDVRGLLMATPPEPR
jgi:hypothetical protein